MFYVILIVDGQAVRSPAVDWVQASKLAGSVGHSLIIPPRIIAAEPWAAERFLEVSEWPANDSLNPMLGSNPMTFAGAN